MILLTVIAEETLSRTLIGRWYDDEHDESTYIVKHLFCLNPNNEVLYFDFPINFNYRNPINKIQELLNPKKIDCIVGEYGWKTHQYDHGLYRRQYVDKKTTYEICQILNDELGFTLYCPCVLANPATVESETQTMGGMYTKVNYPHYLPAPNCCVFGIDTKVMKKINLKEFEKIPFSLKEKYACDFKTEESICFRINGLDDD